MNQAPEDEWLTAQKKPIEVKFRGPYHDTETVETIEGDFEVDEEYIEQHGGYVIICGIEGEIYPCGYDIFRETYEIISRWRCQCDDPVLGRTLAKGTPAEKQYCALCKKRITGTY